MNRRSTFFKTGIRKRVHGLISAGILLSLLLAILPCWTGCASTKGESVFDQSGSCLFNPNYKCALSGKNSREAKEIPASKEPVSQKDGTTSACSTSPWTTTSSSTPIFRGKESDRWTAQLPNGGVLFPKYFNSLGPKVVICPKTIVAQVGTEVVMVSSYVGEDNEYLKTGEKLEWNLDGTGHFLTSNPANAFGSVNRISAKQMTSSTSSKTWRIHRGTATPADDITILRGQSWATVQSAEEGTTAVSVYASNIDNWNNRTDVGQIHWIDATFRYPISCVTPVGQPLNLTTSVFRKTVMQPRSGWIVRYEILSGPSASLGASGETVTELETDSLGQATVPLTLTSGAPGSSKIKVQVIRPAGNGLERAVIDEQIVTEHWSGDAIFSLGFKGPNHGEQGSRLSYEIEVTNRTALPQDAIVRLPLPPGTKIAASNPAVSGYEGTTAVWELDGLPGNSRQLIAFDLDIDTSDYLSFNPRVDQRGASYTTPTDTPPGTPPPPSDSDAPPLDTPGQIADTPPTIPTEQPATQPEAASTVPDVNITAPPPPLDSTPSASVTIESDMFPTAVTQGKEFNGRIRINKTGNLQNVSLSIYTPDKVYVLATDPADKQRKRYAGSPDPVVFNDFQFNEDYAFYFVSDRLGTEEIRFVVTDTESKKVLAREDVKVEIVP